MKISKYLALKSSKIFRYRRFKKFVQKLEINLNDMILDVGGLPDTWTGIGYEERVVLLNIIPPPPRLQIFKVMQLK